MVRAARLHRHGDPLAIEDVELAAPGEGEVRLRLQYAAVNPVDRYLAAGRVAADGPVPRTLGSEASGVVDGRPVVVAGHGLGHVRDGLWAQEAVVPRAAVVPVPDGVDPREAAAVGVAGLTAWHVVQLAQVGADDRVLVLGAAGGVGLPVVSLAASTGARVWGQTAHDAKEAAVRAAGAEHVAVTGADGLAAAVTALRPTVVVDPLGGPFTPAALGVLAPRGRLVLFGTSAGAQATLDLQQLYRTRLQVLGYGGLLLAEEERRTGLEATLRAMSEGRLRIPVDRVLPLDRVEDAFQALADRAVTGKVVLDLA